MTLGAPPRPRRISQEDFARLATLAFLDDPAVSLATQLAAKANVNERTAQRWLNPQGPPAPDAVVTKAYIEADRKLHMDMDLLDRVAQALKSNP